MDDYNSLFKSWEQQCRELKFANKVKIDAMEKSITQEEKLDKKDELIEELEKEKAEALAQYDVE